MKLDRWATALLLVSTVASAQTQGNGIGDSVATYGDQFKQYYPTIAKAKPVIPANVPLEADVVAWSIPEGKGRKATLVRSDGSRVPYENEIGVITIEQRDGPTQFILAKSFRTVDMKWINDRLLYIFCDIGHIAAVEAIFDADRGKWVYQQSISW